VDNDVSAVVTAARQFAAVIEERATLPLREYDLSMGELRGVLAIQRRGRANGRELASELRLTPSAIVAICDRLETRGYVRRVRDRDDRRVTWVVLTDEGASRLRGTEAVFASAKAALRRRLERLSACERTGFVKIAEAFAQAAGQAAAKRR
jgi:DNA-binding MarR family transcriptional regulator